MEKKSISVKMIAGVLIGAVLMFVLNRFASIDTGVSNTSIQLGYGILAAGAAIFGPIAGFLIGFIGHTLVDFSYVVTAPPPPPGEEAAKIWWSWVICSGVFGCAIGYFWKRFKIEEGGFGVKECLTFNVVQILTNLLVWVFLARTLDMVIYKEPFEKITAQGFTAAGMNIAVVLVLGSLLAWGYSVVMAKTGKKAA